MMIEEIRSQDRDPGKTGLKWLPILMYHHVVPQRGKYGPEYLDVTVAEFEEQMKFLRERGYHSIHLEEAARSLAQGKEIVDRPVVITFDDGYLDAYLYALPILRKYHFTADLFLVSSHLDGSYAGDNAYSTPAPLLGKEEVQKMVRQGISIGSHSISHRRLTELGDLAARQEIYGSKVALESLLGVPINSFCFPYGSSTPSLQEMAKEAGYQAACGIEQRDHTLYNLSRIDAARCRGADLRWQARISGLYFRLRRNRILRTLKNTLGATHPRRVLHN